MGMAMVAEKPRALKIVAVCSKDIVKIVIGIYIYNLLCFVLSDASKLCRLYKLDIA
jgi:hypothetical protein